MNPLKTLYLNIKIRKKKWKLPEITSDNNKNKNLKITEIISYDKNKKLKDLIDILRNLYNKKSISDIIPIKRRRKIFGILINM